MKISLIGATGRTGRLILRGGAARGHDMTVLVRDPRRLEGQHDLATRVVCGDATDHATVKDAVNGQDAVVVAVSSRGAQVPVASLIAAAIVNAAAATGVSRLVLTSSYGMVATRPVLVAGAMRALFAESFREQQRSDDIIQDSDTDWTILRATRLTDRPPTGLVQVTPDPLLKGPFSLPRADLGRQLLDLAEHRDHLQTILNITAARS